MELNIDTTALHKVAPPKHLNNLTVVTIASGTPPVLVELRTSDPDGGLLQAMYYGTPPGLVIGDVVRARDDRTDTNILIIEGSGGGTAKEAALGSGEPLFKYWNFK